MIFLQALKMNRKCGTLPPVPPLELISGNYNFDETLNWNVENNGSEISQPSTQYNEYIDHSAYWDNQTYQIM